MPKDKLNPELASKLFAVPGDFLSSRLAREVCGAAQKEFRSLKPRSGTQKATLEELRAIASELAPYARQAAGKSYTIGVYVQDQFGKDIEVECVHASPLLVHFAFVALAILEAEESEG